MNKSDLIRLATMKTEQKTASHTPGPHIVKSASHGVFIEAHPDLNDGHNTAECFGPDAEANARLYAAAPEMLSVLERMERILGDSCDFGVCDKAPSFEAWKEARAAIAKATGK